ncbi:ABC transporter ATP-binding protein [Helicobacter sp. MIT 11-5569]|uniref:ABC transporter ATP-binding protein n=1 Tax=Helicobacter sp. MIT 11-5569 TaxID=1548151 RepID=UPI00051FD5AF|nr:ATP-binding cassette domain-containing protein [Helicobacter sp. MIT 11-5569]TLD81426.1 ABC transporter ATP-binding protein [Helicobacter sp. MIT 11-5569]
MKKLVSFESFSLYHSKHTILRNITYDIYENEMLVLLGSSGSGKSLSARAIMGLLPENLQTTGAVRWHCQRKFGVIMQNPASCFDSIFTIQQHFDETFYAKKLPMEFSTYKKLLKDVELDSSVLKAYPFELSGGMLQRVMIAIALCSYTPLLIADEPSSDLDISGQKELIDLIYHLKTKQDFAILFITHDLNLAQKYADRIILMDKGEIQEQGSKKEFFQSTQNIVSSFVNAHNLLNASEKHFKQNVQEHTDSKILLEAKHVNISYQRGGFFSKENPKKILENIEFCLYKNRNAGIIGANGAGKSTLVKVLLGIQTSPLAKITLNAIPIKHKKEYCRHIGVVFQNPPASLNPRFSAKEAIIEPLKNLGYSQEECNKAMEQIVESLGLNIESLHKKTIHFSGGEQQRIALARAIITKPSVLILDEALSNLDMLLQAQIITLLKQIQQQFSLTYIVISHDMRIIYTLCEDIWEIKDGKMRIL